MNISHLRPALAGAMALSCSSSTPGDPNGGGETCTGYPAWETSAYVLPFAPGTAYRVIQGNCSPPGNGHRGSNRYGYDFGMTIGTDFNAARAGTVVAVEESHLDGEIAATGKDNYIAILHADGTVGLYGHLTQGGAIVGLGDQVTRGQLIGRSGNTGNTNNIPHLHFSLQSCDPVSLGSAACPTIPSTFRNTDPNPGGLQNGVTYPAR